MREIVVLELSNCPYCRQLERILEDWKDRPELKDVTFRWVDERKHPEISGRYSYYYVPSLFLGDRKLYEADPSHSEPVMRKLLEKQLLEALGQADG